jgi:5-formyltetrahydrofolate cyclo-ligase
MTKIKSTIRQEMDQARRALPSEVSELEGKRLIKHFERLRYGVRWLLHAPLHGEISTRPLFEMAKMERGDQVYFPRVQKDQIIFKRVEQWNELTEGAYGLEPPSRAEDWSPQEPSVVIVPGLAFSQMGQRIGFGKGFYDRFLAEFRHLPRLAVAYDFQIKPQGWEPESHDERMDFVITPSSVWSSPRVVNDATGG